MLLESKLDGENEWLIKCHSRGMGNKLGKELTANLVMNVLRWCCDEGKNYFSKKKTENTSMMTG
jgi:hypothetical protein